MKLDIKSLELPEEESVLRTKLLSWSESIKKMMRIHSLRTMKKCGSSKTISDVNGSTRKPHRQKGSGRARQGSKYAVHHRGGGVVFGPTRRNANVSICSSERKIALIRAILVKARNKNVFLLPNASVMNSDKTSAASSLLFSIKNAINASANSSVLFVMDGAMGKGFRNLMMCHYVNMHELNIKDIMLYEYIVLVGNAVEHVTCNIGTL